MATSFHSPPIPGIERLNRVGGAQHSPYLDVVIEERDVENVSVVKEFDNLLHAHVLVSRR